MDTLEESAAVALVAAAASAVGQCPDGEWEAKVQAKAFSLLRIVPNVVERFNVLASCHPVMGVIVKVEEVKGRGLITTEATMGRLQRNQEVADSGRGLEHFRTAWLNEPAGRALFEQASGLIGRHCRFGKRIEEGRDANDEVLKVRMVEWIEDIGPDPLTSGATNAPAPRQSHDTPRSQPQTTTAPSGPIDPEAWFRENGWKSKSEHDTIHRAVHGALATVDEPVRNRFLSWSAGQGYDLKRAWPSRDAMLMQSRLNAFMDEEEHNQMVAAGGVPDYGPNEEPFTYGPNEQPF